MRRNRHEQVYEIYKDTFLRGACMVLCDTLGVLLVALSTSLGWGLRGVWGHWWGATVPGAFCGMALYIAFGDMSSGWQVLIFGAAMAISVSLGGVLSYGRIVGYVKSQHDRSPAFGVFGLFLVGGLWGFFGGVGLGLLMTEVVYGFADLALWAVLASAGAFLFYKLLVVGLDLHLSPPRSDVWAAVLGGSVMSTAYFALWQMDAVVLQTATLGWLGFGGGFALGGLIHRRCSERGLEVNSWKLMEHSVGFGGGLGLALSVVLNGGDLPSIDVPEAGLLVSLFVVLWLVPYMNTSNTFEQWLWNRIGRDLKGDSARVGPDGKPIGGIGRRAFALFQALALLSLLPFFHLAAGLIDRWTGMKRHLWPFLFLISFLTVLAIGRSGPDTSRRGLLVYAIFVAQALICVVLALLI
jgi:hypothetical protein